VGRERSQIRLAPGAGVPVNRVQPELLNGRAMRSLGSGKMRFLAI
jgi:hypothetical protein